MYSLIKKSSTLVPIMTSTTGMAPLGFAVPFFFRYIKFLLLALLYSFLSYCVYKLVIIGEQNYCHYNSAIPVRDICGAPWKFFLSQGNTDPSTPNDVAERVLFVASFVGMVFMRIFYQYRFRSLDTRLDKDNIDITDYSVMIYNLPLNTGEGRVKDFFKTHFKDPETGKYLDISVSSVNFFYQDYEDTIKKGEKLRKQLNEYRKRFDSKDGELIEEMKQKFKEDLEALDESINTLYDQENINATIKTRFTGVAMVTLEREEHADLIKSHYVLKGWSKTIYDLLGYMPKSILNCLSVNVKHEFRGGCYIFLDVPKPPEDIIWENMGKGKMNNLTRQILSTICTLAILILTFLILVGLKVWQIRSEGNFWISILFTIVIKIVNGVAMFFNVWFIGFERFSSSTLQTTEIVWRTTSMTFLNTAAQLVLLNVIIWGSELGSKLWEDNGLANDLWFLLLLSVLDIIGSLVKPDYLFKLIHRRALENDSPDSKFRPTQKEANECYEGFEFSFDERLTKYSKMILIAFFISSLFPISPVIAIIYLFFFYWLDKYFLIRLCKVPSFCTSQLGHSMLRFFDLALVVYTVTSDNNRVATGCSITSLLTGLERQKWLFS